MRSCRQRPVEPFTRMDRETIHSRSHTHRALPANDGLHASQTAQANRKRLGAVVLARKTMATADDSWKDASSIYDFSAVDIDGNEVSLDKYKGHLVELHEKYAESKGLRILAFPCNQFGGQEPGTEADIKKFVEKYNVRFDMFSKVNVNGDKAHPLWKYLKQKQSGFLTDAIKWNFTKFVVDKEGQPVHRYAPTTDPVDIEPDLLKLF
ncbi:hypothetical protein MTO96_048610 [Rhipicephalus appendiculatus]